MNRRPNCKCTVCEKEVYRRPYQIEAGPVYCTSVCTGRALRKNVSSCPVCEKEVFGRSNYCSKSCASTARKGMKYKKNVPYVHRSLKTREELAEVRGGNCERCGRDNFAILEVHHKIERCNGGSDEIDNLELLCPNCHREHHLGSITFAEWKKARE